MKEITEPEMLHRAAAYCSAAERCIQDVQKKIDAAGLPPDASERIIARLLKERFIDESRYTRFFVNDKLRFNKWGRVKIGYELYKKNIPSPIREESLAAIDEGEYPLHLTRFTKKQKEIDKRKRRAGPIQQVTPFRRRTRFRKPDHVGLPKPIIQRNRLRGLCRRHGIICSTCFSPTYVKYVNDHSSREKNKFA